MNRTRIVLADDHAVLRDGLRMAINAQPDLNVVAVAGTGQEAAECVRETDPRLLCLDLSMPGWRVATTIERVRAISPRLRVLILTMHDDPAYLRAAMTAGADGYMLKTTPLDELLTAIRSVAAGGRAVNDSLKASLEDHPAAAPPGPDQLSRREREVLEFLARGHTHQEIAERVFLSVKSVETYRARVREKTGLRTRADFVQYGLDAGLLLPPDSTRPES